MAHRIAMGIGALRQAEHDLKALDSYLRTARRFIEIARRRHTP